MTRALSILPQGTRVAFQAGSLHIEATITRYDAGEDGYYAVDNLGCAWFRSLRELTIKGTLQFSKPFADMDNAELLEAKTLQIAMVDANPANEVEYSILRQISLEVEE